MKLLITVQKSWLLEVTFLKSSYSAWWPVNSNEFAKPFVKPASAIKDRIGFFPGLLSFVYTVDIFANFFAFWCNNKFLVYLYTHKKLCILKYKFAPALESQFLQAALGSFWWEMVFRDYGLGTRGAHCCWVGYCFSAFSLDKASIHFL